MSLLKTNNVYIIGEMVEVKDFREITYGADNKEAISATIVVKCMLGQVENLIEAHTFCSKYTKAGAENKNYKNIANINDLLHKRVVISQGSIDGSRFWSDRTQELVLSNKINFNLIRLARETNDEKEDKATFEFSGFVTRALREIVDADGNTKYYQITLGQANYKEDNMFEVNFAVDKNNIKAIRVIEANYEAGSTVTINGSCNTIVTQNEVRNEVAFGEPTVKVYTNVDRKFFILGGNEPVKGEGEYTEDVIKQLINAYKKSGEEIQLAKKNTSNVAAPSTNKSKASSLAGLI